MALKIMNLQQLWFPPEDPTQDQAEFQPRSPALPLTEELLAVGVCQGRETYSTWRMWDCKIPMIQWITRIRTPMSTELAGLEDSNNNNNNNNDMQSEGSFGGSGEAVDICSYFVIYMYETLKNKKFKIAKLFKAFVLL